ncbi:hydroxyacid dehydrogenase [Haloarchaeobius sp. TZWSO28]|uniref:hydroxyacid dehydrogenase n=1 Tax=Haloarchaeobius sp. TZWSO28 TaxID=3446119 RepID=UPI003EC0E19E
MRILVTAPGARQNDQLYPPDVRNRLETLGEVVWNETGTQYSNSELRDRLRGVDVCITGWGAPTLTAETLVEADSLELVAHVGGSVGDVASDALYEQEVTVCSANHVMAPFVAEGILAAVLSSLRDLSQLDDAMKGGDWPSNRKRRSETLYDATLGFVGLGAVGRNLLSHLEPFDVTVNLYDPYVSADDLADVPWVSLTDLEGALAGADVVSIHAARTPETVHMLDREMLAKLPDGSLLVNAARGAIVDEEALVAELGSGRIAAALDVYEDEPLPEEHPLRDQENALLAPHVAGSPCRRYLADAVVSDIERYSRGEPLENPISRERFELMTRQLECER